MVRGDTNHGKNLIPPVDPEKLYFVDRSEKFFLNDLQISININAD